MRFNDALIGGALLFGALAIALYARTLPATPGQDYGAAVFPMLVAAGLAGCGLAMTFGGLRHWSGPVIAEPWTREPAAWARLLGCLGLIIGYILLADTLGFLLTASFILFVLFLMLGARWWIAAPIAVLVTVIIDKSFSGLLLVPLPRGMLHL